LSNSFLLSADNIFFDGLFRGQNPPGQGVTVPSTRYRPCPAIILIPCSDSLFRILQVLMDLFPHSLNRIIHDLYRPPDPLRDFPRCSAVFHLFPDLFFQRTE